jgi:uncharacterized protein (DUF427 family)
MTIARWKGAVLAESDACRNVEGNAYFPPDAVRREFLEVSDSHTTCPWKGVADYFDVVVRGERNKDAAWTYPVTKPEADSIRGYIAFWKGVEVED